MGYKGHVNKRRSKMYSDEFCKLIITIKALILTAFVKEKN